MGDEVKRTRKSKEMYVNEAVEAGLATREELEAMTVPEIKALATAEPETLPEVVEPKPIQTVEKIPTCKHEWRKVRIVDPNGNYVIIRCYKCGAEKRAE